MALPAKAAVFESAVGGPKAMPPLPASEQRPLSPLVGNLKSGEAQLSPELTGVRRPKEFGASAASNNSSDLSLVRDVAKRRITRPCEALRHAYHAKRRVPFEAVVFLALTRVLVVHWHVPMSCST